MTNWETYVAARAALAWQVELGADEAICEGPVNRYAAPARPQAPAAPTPAAAPDTPDPVVVARAAAGAARDLDGLRAALGAFEGCDLKRGARSTVFADGFPDARVMILGGAPGREADRAGRPMAGHEGALLERMLAAIGLSRAEVYLADTLPWRPPQDRAPTTDEIALLAPFAQRHVELAAPEILVLFGNVPCRALLGREGIGQMRGHWATAVGRPALPMLHPTQLLRDPLQKRDAWVDLLSLKARLG